MNANAETTAKTIAGTTSGVSFSSVAPFLSGWPQLIALAIAAGSLMVAFLSYWDTRQHRRKMRELAEGGHVHIHKREED